MNPQQQVQEPTPEEALALLDKVTVNFQGTRQDHQLISQALSVLFHFIQEHKDNF